MHSPVRSQRAIVCQARSTTSGCRLTPKEAVEELKEMCSVLLKEMRKERDEEMKQELKKLYDIKVEELHIAERFMKCERDRADRNRRLKAEKGKVEEVKKIFKNFNLSELKKVREEIDVLIIEMRVPEALAAREKIDASRVIADALNEDDDNTEVIMFDSTSDVSKDMTEPKSLWSALKSIMYSE
jgi:hypothetical protein